MKKDNDWSKIQNVWNNTEEINSQKLEEMAGKAIEGGNIHNAALSKLKRAFCIEIWVGYILAFVFTATAFLVSSGFVFAFHLLIGLILLTSLTYSLARFNAIKKITLTDGNLKENLVQIIYKTETFLTLLKRTTLIFSLVVIPVGLFITVFGYQMGVYEWSGDLKNNTLVLSDLPPALWIIFAGYLGVGLFVFFLAYRWFVNVYIKRMYGSHLDRLREQLEYIRQE